MCWGLYQIHPGQAVLPRRDRAGLEPPALRAQEERLLELRGTEARALDSEELSLEAIIRISYDALPHDAARRAFRLLATFGPTPKVEIGNQDKPQGASRSPADIAGTQTR